MEVIKEERTITCCNCGSHLIYTNDDIEVVWIGSKTFVRCPICGQKLFDLKPKIIKIWKENLKKITYSSR